MIDCVKSVFTTDRKLILNCDQNNPRNIYRELIERIVNPLYIPLLILISSINVLLVKENKNYLKLRFLIFIFGILTIILSESILGYVDNSFSFNLILISIPIFLFLIIYSTIFYKYKLFDFKT